MEEDCLSKEEVLPNLWLEFKKTKEFSEDGSLVAIPKAHPIVVKREEEGLTLITKRVQKDLTNVSSLYRERLSQRTTQEWIDAWCEQHRLLFSRVLRSKGELRTINVRFGDPTDEHLFCIPDYRLVNKELAELAYKIHTLLQQKDIGQEEIISITASVHYDFIRIHPFADGNGRIGRVLIDQLCLAYDLPMVGGYPRTKPKLRKIYHEAIRDAAIDPLCTKLQLWMNNRIQEKLRVIT